MAESLQIEGMKELETILKGLPEKAGKRAMQSSFRKCAKPLLDSVKRTAPVKSGETKKSARIVNTKGAGVKVGFSRKGKDIPAYMKAYWKAFGTLANRMSSHRFLNKRKSKSAKWKGGIQPNDFFNEAYQNTMGKVTENIGKDFSKNVTDYINKKKAS